jgi:hypothetical protein
LKCIQEKYQYILYENIVLNKTEIQQKISTTLSY